MPGVNFINILRAHFALIFWRQKILYPNHSFVIFGAKILYKKCTSKVLMKLFAGVNFTNILQAAFSRFFLVTVFVFFCGKKIGTKIVCKNVEFITGRLRTSHAKHLKTLKNIMNYVIRKKQVQIQFKKSNFLRSLLKT
jgi:hypothetical protein